MATCDECGEQASMPYRCRLCGGAFCSNHRLPENHDCPGLENWEDPSGVFDGSTGGRTAAGREESGVLSSLGLNAGVGGPLAYFRGNVTYVLLGLMWLTFFVQYVVAPVFGIDRSDELWYLLFTVNTTHPEFVWTWITATFSHGGPFHILLNSIVLYFFGPPVERRVGSGRFAALFLTTGALASLAQIGAVLVQNPSWYGQPLTGITGSAVLGASGAIAAVMGVLTVLNPHLRIYLYFIIPMPLWVATALFAGYSVLMSTVGGVGAGGFAQVAHLAGLGLGVLYGLKLKREGERAPEQIRFGGGGGGGRRRGPGGRGPF